MLKRFLNFGVIASALLLFGAVTLTAQAATPPAGTTPPRNDIPATALPIDGTPQSIPAHASLWYMVNYPGAPADVIVTLHGGTHSGLKFDVYAPTQIGDWYDDTPIGRGTAPQIKCTDTDTGLRTHCTSNDLEWKGNFRDGGPVYIQVTNPTDQPLNFQLVSSLQVHPRVNA